MVFTSIETKRFYLRQLSLNDVTDRYLHWVQDKESNPYIITADSKISKKSLKNYISERINREDILFLGIFLKENDLHIGNIKFEPIDYTNSITTMGMLIGDENWRGRGVAEEVVNACAEWLYENRSLLKMDLGVDKKNESAIRSYNKAGFRIIKKVEQNQYYRDNVKMIRKHSPSLKLALGTVQFGFDYGIANTSGQVKENEATAIIQNSWNEGIGTLDTAIAYGSSELLLGNIGIKEWQIISKLPAVPENCPDINSWVREMVEGSLSRLKISKLNGLLLHQSLQLINPHGEDLYKAMLSLKEDGLVGKIGISIYNPEELDRIFPKYELDIVQAPYNILDRRLQTSGWLKKLHHNGCTIHTRSAFLQGLLLMNANERPGKFSRWQTLWDKWDYWLKKEGLTPVQACLGFTLSQPEIDRVIFGVDNCTQLKEILKAAEVNIPEVPDYLICEDTELINPSKWSEL